MTSYQMFEEQEEQEVLLKTLVPCPPRQSSLQEPRVRVHVSFINSLSGLPLKMRALLISHALLIPAVKINKLINKREEMNMDPLFPYPGHWLSSREVRGPLQERIGTSTVSFNELPHGRHFVVGVTVNCFESAHSNTPIQNGGVVFRRKDTKSPRWL